MREAQSYAPIARWYVLFRGKGARKYVVDWLNPPGFRHCLAFGYDVCGARWLIYDVSRGGTLILALESAAFDRWLTAIRRDGAQVLRIETRQAERFWLQIGMWCVASVRHLIGARSWALRPIGLWRDLKREGAEVVFAETA